MQKVTCANVQLTEESGKQLIPERQSDFIKLTVYIHCIYKCLTFDLSGDLREIP